MFFKTSTEDHSSFYDSRLLQISEKKVSILCESKWCHKGDVIVLLTQPGVSSVAFVIKHPF